MKSKLAGKELAETEVRKKRAAELYRDNQKSNPGPVTNVDVARILGMPEEMIKELFGEESRTSDDNKTGKGDEELPGYPGIDE